MSEYSLIKGEQRNSVAYKGYYNIKEGEVMSKPSMRDKVIASAILLFAKHGYTGTSTAQIAKEAGCAEGTIFRYFPKKIDLLRFVASEFIRQFGGGIATKTLYEIVESSEDMTAVEFIEALMYDRMKLLRDNSEILKIVVYEINFHDELKAQFFNEFMTNLKGVGSMVSDVLADKLEMDQIDFMLALRGLMGQIFAILFQLNFLEPDQVPDDDQKLHELVHASAQLLINGLKGM